MSRAEREIARLKEIIEDRTKDVLHYDAELKEIKAKLVEATNLVIQLTQQIQDGSRSYMHTLGAIAYANGGEIRIPCSAIDAIEADDVMENKIDEINDCIVFTLTRKDGRRPTGIILPSGRH